MRRPNVAASLPPPSRREWSARGAQPARRLREVVREGARIADRHRVTVTKRDGTVSRLEVYLFGEISDDGRLRRVDEISRVVSGSDDDDQLARTG
jgi:hypothetical protein